LIKDSISQLDLDEYLNQLNKDKHESGVLLYQKNKERLDNMELKYDFKFD
jgi:hypothetical protein